MISGISFGPVSRHASLSASVPVRFSIERKDPSDVALGNLIRHGFIRETGHIVSREIRGLKTLNYSLLLPEIIVRAICNAPLVVPREFFADKILVLFGNRDEIVENKDAIGRDFVKYSTVMPVPMSIPTSDVTLTTDDLTVIFAPFSGPVSVLHPRVIFPQPHYLGRLNRGTGIGFALQIVSPDSDESIDARKFAIPEYAITGDIGVGTQVDDRRTFAFGIARKGLIPASFRKTVTSIVSETNDEIAQIMQHISKNRLENPIFYGTNVPQPLRLLAEVSSNMGILMGVAKVMTPIGDKDMYSFNIVFSSDFAKAAFIEQSSKITALIGKRLAALSESAVLLPAIDTDENASYLISGQEDSDIVVDIEDYLRTIEPVDAIIETRRETLGLLGEIGDFASVEDHVRGVPKASIREYLSKSKMRFLTNAGTKIAELVSMFPDVFDSRVNETFLVGELPGSFVATLMEIYGKKFSWTAQSLVGGSALDDKYGFVKRFPERWDFGPKTYNGDITNEKLQKYYMKNYMGKVALFISDIGTDGDDRQKSNAFLYTASAKLAIRVLKTGGAAVLKTFGLMRRELVETTVLLMKHFEDVYVAKPVSSSPFNLEVYVIAVSKLEKPRSGVTLDKLVYAVTANAMRVETALNRLEAFSRTKIAYGLTKIPKTVVSDGVEFIDKIMKPR